MSWWFSEERMFVIYLVLLSIGVVAALVIAARGDANGPLPVSPFSPVVLVIGLTCLGGAGVLALRLFRFPPGLSLLAAVIFALLSASLFSALATAARRAAERRRALADLVGALAHVVTPIPPGGVGTITTNGLRPTLTLPATSRHAAPLPPGTTVVVTALHGSAAEVAPLPPEQ